jgi:hypothetical protein
VRANQNKTWKKSIDLEFGRFLPYRMPYYIGGREKGEIWAGRFSKRLFPGEG